MKLRRDTALLWKEVRNSKCTECSLHEHAQTVCLMGVGPVPAKVMVLGEAPGYREDDIRRPFSGKSGRLLDETLEKIGLPREDCFITNVNKCRPPENRTPNKTEQKACRHYLEDELRRVQPDFILCLGNSALSLIHKGAIMKNRGKTYDFRYETLDRATGELAWKDCKVFATIHPAMVLRNPRFGAMFDNDLANFARLTRGQTRPPKTKVYVVHDATGLAKMCRAIMISKAVAYDIETNGFNEFDPEAKIATLGVAVKPGLAFVLPVHHPEARWKDPIRALRSVVHALAYTNARRIAHNAKFDDRWLSRISGTPLYADFDTMLAAHVLDENRFKSLKFLGELLLGVDAWGIDVSEGQAMVHPLKKVALYNALDCDYTLQLYYLFRKQLTDPANVRLLRIFTMLMMPGSHALTDIERVGLYLDQERLADRRVKVDRKLRIIKKKLTKLVGYDFNPNSPIQLARIMFEEMGLDIIETTGKGNPSTNESVMLRLKDKYEIASLVLEWRKWVKYSSSYIENWTEKQDQQGRLHANYKLAGTVTGRLSSGKEEGDKSRGLNAQQIPRDPFIRSIIGSPPGYKFVEADFAQVELRLAAHYSQDPVMMRIFLNNEDPHMTMAMKMTGKPAHAVAKEERKKAKGVNFGFLYGMGAAKFITYARDSYGVNVSEPEAYEARKDFFDMYATLPRWHERQRRLARIYHSVNSAIGRVRHLPDIESEDKEVRGEAERQAINSPVQSLGSDMMLLSMSMLHEMMPSDEARIVGTVHDSLLFEVREDRVDYWAKTIRDTMENLPLQKKFGVTLSVPIKVDVSVGDHWSEGEEVA